MTAGDDHSILIVDDEHDGGSVQATLRAAGYDVMLVCAGEQALEHFARAPRDMVMLDAELPDGDGYEVCRRLREMGGPMLPVVMVTRMDDLASIEAAYHSGATDFVSKPVHHALIVHRVRYLFRGHRAVLELQAVQHRSAAILGAIPDVLFEVDADGRILDYRAPRVDQLAVPPGVFLGKTVGEVLPPAAAAACLEAVAEALAFGISSGRQYELLLPRGHAWYELSVSRREVADGETPRVIALSRDITERKLAEARITRMAYCDSLTGLPNRRSFLDLVAREIVAAQVRGRMLAVLFLDLDGFKDVNVTLGHAAGDLLLQATAARLREGLRQGDLLSRPSGVESGAQPDVGADLARLGGDEFAVLLAIDGPHDAHGIASRIGHVMQRPFEIDGRTVMLGVSVGIAIYPNDGHDATALLRHADAAMYRDKRADRGDARVVVGTSWKDGGPVRSRVESASLKSALERRELELVFQPQFDTRHRRARTVEALLRWHHPTQGVVSPLEVVQLAEESGLMQAIGRWIIRAACDQALRWQRDGLEVAVAVNLSPVQIADPRFVDAVARVLHETGLPAHRLEFEVTERALAAAGRDARAAFVALRERGVQLALDDFGLDEASLSCVTTLPFDHLKIDRSVVARMLDHPRDDAFVRATLAVGRSLGTKVTAEGVETVEQSRALIALGCVGQQGNLHAPAVGAPMIPEVLAQAGAHAPTAGRTGEPPATPGVARGG
jgi:predicted signal transduction protein with EAL and GGDEF domain/FixJ family two-component response regulator